MTDKKTNQDKKQENNEEKKTEVVETKKDNNGIKAKEKVKIEDKTKEEEKKIIKTEATIDQKKDTGQVKSDGKKDKKEQKEKVRKEEALAYGANLHVSKKHCMYVCDFIKNKSIDSAIKDLENVIKLKKIVPFKGEIPHRKGNIMSGRYPVNASKIFISLLKGLKGNSIVNGLDIDKTRIYFASANWASRPARKTGRGKRTNLILKAKEIIQPMGVKK